MIKIGLTGGIGSGKSVASDMFSELGTHVIDTDIIARTVLVSSPSLISTLTENFGKDILDETGNLNRAALRDIAFKNNRNKKLLDSIMHPAIRQATINKINDIEKLSPKYCIIVVPLLFETGFKELVDRVLVVTAPHHKKLKWLKQRSNMNQEQAEKVMASQSSDEEKLSIANDHIHNNSDIQHIKNCVNQLHELYLNLK